MKFIKFLYKMQEKYFYKDKMNGKNTLINTIKDIFANDTGLVRDRLVEFRKLQKWNQSDLAKKIGVLQNHISRLESGNLDFVIEMVLALWKYCSVNPNWQLPGLGEMYIYNIDKQKIKGYEDKIKNLELKLSYKIIIWTIMGYLLYNNENIFLIQKK
jgi:transcriptional regulator with XRE-family HTH domain